jgi:hypothetical protein
MKLFNQLINKFARPQCLKFKYCFTNKELYYDKHKNSYYFKVATQNGLICRDITIDELFAERVILNNLDQESYAYACYVAGKLESLANSGQNSSFKFHGISPFDSNKFLVQQLDNGEIHEWDIVNTYSKENYLNLDKSSIMKFAELYLSYASNNNKNDNLKLVK